MPDVNFTFVAVYIRSSPMKIKSSKLTLHENYIFKINTHTNTT